LSINAKSCIFTDSLGGFVKNYILTEFITEKSIREKTALLAEEINRDFDGRELLVVGVLKGSFIFMADLVRQLTKPIVETAFITVSSYKGASTKSSGAVQLVCDIDKPLKDKCVLLVEDIVDTGYTINYLTKMLKVRDPERVAVCALLDKPSRRIMDFVPDYTGFSIPDKFVVGYGLDFDGRYRNLPDIKVVEFE
jgi:hypoxanthine phosphoribosyltransferase